MVHSGLHHLHKRKRIHVKHEKYPHPNRLKRFFDRVILGVCILVPLSNLPQLFKIWLHKDASGVSALSWGFFACFSSLLLVYGVLHKEKPIVLMYCLLAIIQVSVAVGAIVYS
jgi:uncharacterized protein with PQ loop repeat